jgi:acetyl esterase/lipase
VSSVVRLSFEMATDDILTLPPPPADARVAYGTDRNQFGDLRLPKTKGLFPVVMNIHGGYWRAKYDLAHAGHPCAALTAKGLATWNVEYRRVGNAGGGWPGTFEDIRASYRFLSQVAKRYNLDLARSVVMGHSAGGQLALCLAGHEPSAKHVISLAGVVDLRQAWEQHLSDDAVVEFLGGKPKDVPEHYREADPMQLSIRAIQWLIHGAADDTVPPYFSRNYSEQKKKRGEDVHYLEISTAGHFQLIDPRSNAWPKVENTVLHMLGF